jgi:serine/threonine protein phosphatase 1
VLGDAIDRGPDSCGVIQQLLELRDACQLVCLMGNHEEMMLNFLDESPLGKDWLLCGGDQTMASYGANVDRSLVPKEHVAFLRKWIDFWECETHLFVHAAYDAEQPLAAQRWNVWRWHSLRDSIPGPHISDKTAIVGHTSQKDGEILDVGHLICVDTYCWGGGWLTAYDVTSQQVWQVDRSGRRRSQGKT